MDASQANDWDLLASAGEAEALGILFERHKDFVFRLACGFLAQSELAEDVTQEVFLRLARGHRRWRPRAKFTTWLYKMTLNTSRELARRQDRDRRRQEDPSGPPRELHERSAPPPSALPLDIQRILSHLPERQREVLVLRYFEGCSTRETARLMGCREGTVKAHLHRAMGRLRDAFSGETTCA